MEKRGETGRVMRKRGGGGGGGVGGSSVVPAFILAYVLHTADPDSLAP